ncbi:MAG: thermonuclease family protein [Inquilinaceae bacterium]
MRRTLVSGLVGAILAGVPAAAQVTKDPFMPLSGPAQAVEGDLLSVNGTLVRLYGIDAPDRGQTCRSRRDQSYDCAEAARAMLDRLIDGAEVDCVIYHELSDNQNSGLCRVGSADLGGAMVMRGWAFSHRSLSNRYNQHEAVAHSRRAGVWAGRAERPSHWRSRQAAR